MNPADKSIDGLRSRADIWDFIRQQLQTPGALNMRGIVGNLPGIRLEGPVKVALVDVAPAPDNVAPLLYSIDNAGTIETRVVFPNGNDKLLEDDS